MGKHIACSLFLIFLLFFLPWLWGEPSLALEPEGEDIPPAADRPAPPEDPAPPQPAGDADAGMALNVLVGGKLQQMDMGTYLLGVVRAEMPASFEEEALKAQAVAARTYTLYKMANGGDRKSVV